MCFFLKKKEEEAGNALSANPTLLRMISSWCPE
jgi:hypothetical protein